MPSQNLGCQFPFLLGTGTGTDKERERERNGNGTGTDSVPVPVPRKILRAHLWHKEYLVLWTGWSIDDASWTPAGNFTSARELQKMVKRDKPVEDSSMG